MQHAAAPGRINGPVTVAAPAAVAGEPHNGDQEQPQQRRAHARRSRAPRLARTLIYFTLELLCVLWMAGRAYDDVSWLGE
jgi:hypothetical protein